MRPFIQILTSSLVFLGLVSLSLSVWLMPTILDAPRGTKSICYSDSIEDSIKGEEGLPYLRCVNDATLKIDSAFLTVSNSNACPLVYNQVSDKSPPSCSSNNYANSNVTQLFMTLCNTKEKCVFSFHSFSPLICVVNSPPQMSNIPSEYQMLNVVYRCLTPRRRFRPFSNKRYNQKFTRTFNHPVRKISYNHLMSL